VAATGDLTVPAEVYEMRLDQVLAHPKNQSYCSYAQKQRYRDQYLKFHVAGFMSQKQHARHSPNAAETKGTENQSAFRYPAAGAPGAIFIRGIQ